MQCSCQKLDALLESVNFSPETGWNQFIDTEIVRLLEERNKSVPTFQTSYRISFTRHQSTRQLEIEMERWQILFWQTLSAIGKIYKSRCLGLTQLFLPQKSLDVAPEFGYDSVIRNNNPPKTDNCTDILSILLKKLKSPNLCSYLHPTWISTPLKTGNTSHGP